MQTRLFKVTFTYKVRVVQENDGLGLGVRTLETRTREKMRVPLPWDEEAGVYILHGYYVHEEFVSCQDALEEQLRRGGFQWAQVVEFEELFYTEYSPGFFKDEKNNCIPMWAVVPSFSLRTAKDWEGANMSASQWRSFCGAMARVNDIAAERGVAGHLRVRSGMVSESVEDMSSALRKTGVE